MSGKRLKETLEASNSPLVYLQLSLNKSHIFLTLLPANLDFSGNIKSIYDKHLNIKVFFSRKAPLVSEKYYVQSYQSENNAVNIISFSNEGIKMTLNKDVFRALSNIDVEAFFAKIVN